MQRKTTILAALLLVASYCFSQKAQSKLETLVSLEVTAENLAQVLRTLESQVDFRFAYSAEDFNTDRLVTLSVSNQSLRTLLGQLFSSTEFTFKERGDKILIIKIEAPAVFQTVRGTVLEAETNQPIPGANVIIVGSEPLQGASTDELGRFRISNVPVGRQTIKISFAGYLAQTLSNLAIDAGKETVLNISLEESVTELSSVVVTAQLDKAMPLNEMALISAKSFSVEETSRYAGSFNDPARMATSYAGVVSSNDDTDNGIIVRGNSPRGLLWRLEGLEIPNPNHFASDGASSGSISMLNSNMMTNSDFLTGAFPAEYGNAFSGVFDMKLRNGNNEKREYAIQAGLLGIDASFEGPIRGKNSNVANSSYLINYRYSTISLIESLGLDIAGPNTQVPAFQDIAFKFNMPTAKLGTFSLYGLGGKSDGGSTEDVDVNGQTVQLEEKEEYKLGLIGLNHVINVGDKSFLETSTSLSQYDYKYLFENVFEGQIFLEDTESYLNTNLRFASTYNTKLSARHSTKIGAIYTRFGYDLNSRGFFPDRSPSYSSSEDGSFGMHQAFVSHKFKPSNDLTLTAGFHYIHLNLAGQNNLEPRFGLRWQFKENQAFSLGFGMHSRKEETSLYFTEILSDANATQSPNRALDLAKARHFVVGYDYRIKDDLNLKIEAYYQDLYDIPVSNDPNSTYSSLNQEDAFQRLALVNEGTGTNYGVELTLEKFLSRGYFFLLTGSLYDSKYTTLSGFEYNSRYNGGYNLSFVGGKEFQLRSGSKNKVLSVGAETVFGGGSRTNEIDLQESIQQGTTVFVPNTPFARRLKDYMRIDFQISLKTNKKGITHELKLDVQNLTARSNVISERFSATRNEIVQSGFIGDLLPVLSYKITF